MAWQCMAWCMIWPGGHGTIYDISWRTWHGVCYDLAGITWYMVWPVEVYNGMWKVIELHALSHCHGIKSRSHMECPMSIGVPVHTYRTRSQVEGLLHAWFRSLWAGIVNREIINL